MNQLLWNQRRTLRDPREAFSVPRQFGGCADECKVVICLDFWGFWLQRTCCTALGGIPVPETAASLILNTLQPARSPMLSMKRQKSHAILAGFLPYWRSQPCGYTVTGPHGHIRIRCRTHQEFTHALTGTEPPSLAHGCEGCLVSGAVRGEEVSD